MKKILKFLKCKNIDDLFEKLRGFEVSDEIEEFKEVMNLLGKKSIENKDLKEIIENNDLIEYLKREKRFLNTEEFSIILINNRNKIIKEEVLFKGTIDRSAVYPRVIVEKALKHPTKAIICVHNHPSGEVYPSQKDKFLTKELSDLLEKLDILLLDHIIIGDNNHYSFLESGEIVY